MAATVLLSPSSWASLPTLPITSYLPNSRKWRGGLELPCCPRLWEEVEPSPGPLLPPCGTEWWCWIWMPSAQCTSHKGTKRLLCPSASLPSPVYSSSALLCFYLKETTAIGHLPMPVWPAPSPMGKVVVSWAGAVEVRAPGATQVVPIPSLCSSWALLGSAGSGADLENSGAHCYGPCTHVPFSEGPPLAQPGNLLAWPLALGHGED